MKEIQISSTTSRRQGSLRESRTFTMVNLCRFYRSKGCRHREKQSSVDIARCSSRVCGYQAMPCTTASGMGDGELIGEGRASSRLVTSDF